MTAPASLTWWRSGERLLAATADRVTDDQLDGPSVLPGWSRRRLLAHAAGNAEALVNLLTWARTGIETPMYASPQAREAGIAQLQALPSAELHTAVAATAGRLREAVETLPEAAWSAQVRTAQGRTVPASAVPWMRCREVWVHAVDLDAGTAFTDVPPDVAAALVDDVLRMWALRGEVPAVALQAGERTWGDGATVVRGELPALLAWIAGRSAGSDLEAPAGLPVLPAWL